MAMVPCASVLHLDATECRGPRVTYNPGEMNFPRFTAWMGNNSSQGKQRRLTAELNTKLLAAGVVCDKQSIRLMYMPTFRLALTAPLAKNGADGIDDVISIMQSYLIDRFALLQLGSPGNAHKYSMPVTCTSSSTLTLQASVLFLLLKVAHT